MDRQLKPKYKEKKELQRDEWVKNGCLSGNASSEDGKTENERRGVITWETLERHHVDSSQRFRR